MDERGSARPRARLDDGASHRRPLRGSGSRSIASYFLQASNSSSSSSSHQGGGDDVRDDARRPAQNSSLHRRGRDRDRDRDSPRRGGHTHTPTVPRPDYPPGQRDALRAVARETLQVLPPLLRQLGTRDQASYVESVDPFTMPAAIGSGTRPRYTQPATIRVVNQDTLDAALELIGWPASAAAPIQAQPPPPPPLIVNFANHAKPGGGWRRGALAQEEALCYRSSLYLSISESRYPLDREEVLYSPYVLVVRAGRPSGHGLLTAAPCQLPVVSAVSVAALQSPRLRTIADDDQHDNDNDNELMAVDEPPRLRTVLAYETDRFATKLKMRLVLRTAARNGHDQLVLGALGCGVFGNPPEEVARCWLEVLREPEFAGGDMTRSTADEDEDGGREETREETTRHWWKDVVFAIYDGQPGPSGRQIDIGAQGGGGGSRSNLAIFRTVLHGQVV